MSNYFLFFFIFYARNIYYSGTLADEALYYSTIYPNSRDLGTPNQILQCAASLAAGSYDRPCGPTESLF